MDFEVLVTVSLGDQEIQEWVHSTIADSRTGDGPAQTKQPAMQTCHAFTFNPETQLPHARVNMDAFCFSRRQ